MAISNSLSNRTNIAAEPLKFNLKKCKNKIKYTGILPSCCHPLKPMIFKDQPSPENVYFLRLTKMLPGSNCKYYKYTISIIRRWTWYRPVDDALIG